MKKKQILSRDKNFIWHPFTQEKNSEEPIIIGSAKDEKLYDIDGNEYIDLISSWWVNIHGHGRKKIIDSIFNQAKKLDDFLESLAMQISFTIALEAEDEILLNRLLKRGEASGRSDDINKEKILNRFKEYNDKTLPLKEFYSKQNKFFSINGVGGIKVISERLISIIENS